MSRTLSILLFLVLTADALLVFLIPVMIYGLTGSLALSGLTFAMAWLPRIIITPLVGAAIDRWGVRLVSVVSDVAKLCGCVGAIAVLLNKPEPLVVTVAGGLLSGLIATGTAQSLIAYEKMIALASQAIDRDVNLLCRIDQLAMVAGPLLGFIGFAAGAVSLLSVAAVMYAINGVCYFFSRSIPKNPHIERVSGEPASTGNVRLILLTSPLLASVMLAVGNNAFDGLVEASAVALIDRAMLPIEYFAFVDMCAGLCGVAATLLYPCLAQAAAPLRLFVSAALVTITASALMIVAQGHLVGFLALHAINVGGKVFVFNFTRNLRIRLVPTHRLAGASSLMTLMNQAVLPMVGLALYAAGERTQVVSMLMALAIGISVWATYRIYHLMRATPPLS
jgi:hypothetical protein